MSGNSFGTLYCVTSFGESHGPAYGGVGRRLSSRPGTEK
jgi:chorismate synthase